MIDGDQAQGRPSLSLAFLEPGLMAVEARTCSHGGRSRAGRRERDEQQRSDESDSRSRLGQRVGGREVRRPRLAGAAAERRQPESAGHLLVLGEREHRLGRQRHRPRAEARDEQAANSLRDVIRGVMALAKLQSNAYPQFQASSTRSSSAAPARPSPFPSTSLQKSST